MPLVKNFDKQAILKAVKEDEEFGKYAAECWRKRVEPYVPYNTGRLCNDVTVTPFSVKYNAPYADTVYNNPGMNFRKEKHPLATARWHEVAAPAIRDYYIQDLQEYMDRKEING